MRNVRQILHYRLEKKISAEQTALALKVSKGTVINTLSRFHQSGLAWPLPEDLSDTILEARLYPQASKDPVAPSDLPTVTYLEEELAKKHVTLQCLYDEYAQSSMEPVSRSSFYRHFQRVRPQEPRMAVEHRGGDLVYVDYSGDGLWYTDRQSGQRVDVEFFCCCWGLSSYSYAESTHSQKKRDFSQSHVRAFKYFGVVPHGLVPDNLKSAVTKYHPFDPVLNPLYEELGRHYNVAILPARIRKPRDKAKVESGVLHMQQFILARLRNRQFTSLQEINQAIWELLELYNSRGMKDYGFQSRRERFERLDRPYAQSLPSEPFRIVDVKHNVLVAKIYHIQYDEHFYSVPFEHVGKRVTVRRCGGMVEIFLDAILLTRHLYSTIKYTHTTKTEHMPKAHQFVKGLTPGWIIAQAAQIGENTVDAVVEIMRRFEHVQQGFNGALGVLSLAKAFTPVRLEAACKRCLHFKMVSYRSLKSVLQKELDQKPLTPALCPPDSEAIIHENLRRDYTSTSKTQGEQE